MRKYFIILFLMFLLNSCVGSSTSGVFGTGVSIALDPRTLGTQIDDSLMQKNLQARLVLTEKENYIILADEEQFNRVFLNLIKNSIESINEKKRKNVVFKGKIKVDIKDDSSYIYVNIVDNGVGFENVNKEKMLTPYYTTKEKGTGLGLAIVTKIISDHNSTILFKSIKDGAQVKITIPRYYV